MSEGNEQFLKLAERIRDEFIDLDRLAERVQAGWHQAQSSGDDLYLDSVALNLHGFYQGIERLFEMIATLVDGAMPQGAAWYQILLQQMAADVPRTRPPVISEETRVVLDEYRGFRHIVRHVYTFKFDPAKIQRLAEGAPAVLIQVRQELLDFANFLDQLAQDNGK